MPSRRPGTVTILFTELVGHTALYHRLGQAEAAKLVTGHWRLLRKVLKRHRGREVKSLFEGDSLMVAFPTASAALLAAIEMQQAVSEDNRSRPKTALRMRIGLNTGEPVVEGDDLLGTAVIVAKRLCDKAKGGQILASESTYAVVKLEAEFAFTDEGPKGLKGIAEPVRAYAVAWEEEQDAPVLRTILFTDIIGSLLLFQQLGEQGERSFRRAHNAIFRERAAAYGALEIKSMGDGFMLAFRDARNALRCAVDLRRALTAHSDEHLGGRLRLRMGLDAGEVTSEEGELYGRPIGVAARLCGHGQAGEILASFRLKELAEGAEDVRLTELDEVELRGLSGRYRVFQVEG